MSSNTKSPASSSPPEEAAPATAAPSPGSSVPTKAQKKKTRDAKKKAAVELAREQSTDELRMVTLTKEQKDALLTEGEAEFDDTEDGKAQAEPDSESENEGVAPAEYLVIRGTAPLVGPMSDIDSDDERTIALVVSNWHTMPSYEGAVTSLLGKYAAKNGPLSLASMEEMTQMRADVNRRVRHFLRHCN